MGKKLKSRITSGFDEFDGLNENIDDVSRGFLEDIFENEFSDLTSDIYSLLYDQDLSIDFSHNAKPLVLQVESILRKYAGEVEELINKKCQYMTERVSNE